MRRLAAALENVRTSRSRIGKEEAIGALLAGIGGDASDDEGVALATAARIAAGYTLPVGDGRSLGVGWSLLQEVIASQTGWPPEVLHACARRCGDLGEAFGLLVARDDAALGRPGVTLHEAKRLFDALADGGSRLGKRRLLDPVFARATPLETKYLAKSLLGSLRVGAQSGVVEGAVARAFGESLEDVRRAAALVTDLGIVAVLARNHRLGDARFEIGRPVAFMLATPMETIASPIDPAALVIEDKIDGVRAQVHKLGGDVTIFARGLDRVTTAFPEVVDALRFVSGSFALDGELVVLGEGGRPRPFQALQARLRKTAPTVDNLREAPVTFIAYDLLADDAGSLLAQPWLERRRRLDALAALAPAAAFAINRFEGAIVEDVPWATRLDLAFSAARARGHEGLVLKRRDAPYEAGRRGQSWIKVKRAYATLDVVVTAAEEGHGRRAGVLSDYTFGVWTDGALANVGKAYSGLTDDEIDSLTRRLEKLTVERFGGTRLVKPEIVLEVAFDGIQLSKRHKSGYALRFPRIVRIRDDKRPDEADRVEAVEAIFRAQLASGHREETPKGTLGEAPPKKKRSPPKKNDAQLDLFGLGAAPPRKR